VGGRFFAVGTLEPSAGSGAAGTQAGKRQLVVFENETLGNHLLESARASRDIEEPVACLAMEVVMVLGRDTCQFVPITGVRYRDADDLSGILKVANHAIDGSLAQSVDRPGGDFQNLLDGQWSARGLDGLADRFELLRGSLLGHGIRPLVIGSTERWDQMRIVMASRCRQMVLMTIAAG
jgi:hypothetical protein